MTLWKLEGEFSNARRPLVEISADQNSTTAYSEAMNTRWKRVRIAYNYSLKAQIWAKISVGSKIELQLDENRSMIYEYYQTLGEYLFIKKSNFELSGQEKEDQSARSNIVFSQGSRDQFGPKFS